MAAVAVLCGSALAGTSTISVPAQSFVGQGAHVWVPISIDPIDDAVGIDLTLSYDPSVVTALDVIGAPLVSSFTLTEFLGEPGEVHLSLFKTVGVTGSGTAVWIRFLAVGAPGASSSLIFKYHELNEGQISSSASNGAIEILPAAEAVLSMPDDANGAPGATVQVPIRANPADGMIGLDLRIEWDPEVLTAIGASATPFSPSFAVVPNFDTPGVALLSVFGSNDPMGSGPIAQIEFLVIGNLGDQSPLDLVSGEANRGNVTTTLDDGLFTVCADADMDGVTVCGGDCDDRDSMVGPTPPLGDTIEPAGEMGPALLLWTDETLPGPFQLYRGWRKPAGPFEYNQYCVESGLFVEEGEDALVPLPETLFFYLVTREGICDESLPGLDSHAQPIPNPDPCPASVELDSDGDGIQEAIDTCPGISDPSQDDADGDSYGDLCDNCPVDYNPTQEDNSDADGIGEICDLDDDNDGVPDLMDTCPLFRNPAQMDDPDGDGLGTPCDNCPMVPNANQLDSDHDGQGDACD